MKKRMKILSLSVAAAICAACAVSSLIASGESTYYDFEDGSSHLRSLYGGLDAMIKSETNGNHYLRLEYDPLNDHQRDYFESYVEGVSFSNTNKLQVDYDVMYEEFAAERTGEIHIKKRTGSGSDQTTMVARLSQYDGYLQVQGNTEGFRRISDTNGAYFHMETGHWYSIRMTVDMANHVQSTYIFDRDTQSLLALNQEITTISDISDINMISFSSKYSMCIDNIKISAYSCEDCYISGAPYVKKGNHSRYYCLGKDMDDNAAAMPYGGTTVWSIENPRSGVSINNPSGNLVTSSIARPGPVILKAVRTVGNKTYEAKYLINIIN